MRLSDFKSNEYTNLLGGDRYEPHEENPMLGFRGASRYIAPEFYDCFALECEAMKRVRDTMGFTNVEIMIPFVRTLTEAASVIALLAKNGLRRGENGLRVIMMCELPSNAILAERFLEHFDGFSIGSNDMTQLTLGVDRDSGGPIASTFDERDDAVKAMLSLAIKACQKHGKYVGICGQGPSDHPDLAQWLVEQGIESMSLNPDTVVETWLALRRATAAVASTPGVIPSVDRSGPSEQARVCAMPRQLGHPADRAARDARAMRGMRLPPSVHVVLGPSRIAGAGVGVAALGHARRRARRCPSHAWQQAARCAGGAGVGDAARSASSRCGAARVPITELRLAPDLVLVVHQRRRPPRRRATCASATYVGARLTSIVWRAGRRALVARDPGPAGHAAGRRLPAAARDAALCAQRGGAGRAGEPGLSVDQLAAVGLASGPRAGAGTAAPAPRAAAGTRRPRPDASGRAAASGSGRERRR